MLSNLWTLLSSVLELNQRGAGCFLVVNGICQSPPVHQPLILQAIQPAQSRAHQITRKRKLTTTVRFSEKFQPRPQSSPLGTTFKRCPGLRGAQFPVSTCNFSGRGNDLKPVGTTCTVIHNLEMFPLPTLDLCLFFLFLRSNDASPYFSCLRIFGFIHDFFSGSRDPSEPHLS